MPTRVPIPCLEEIKGEGTGGCPLQAMIFLHQINKQAITNVFGKKSLAASLFFPLPTMTKCARTVTENNESTIEINQSDSNLFKAKK